MAAKKTVILIVEDDLAHRKMLKLMLTSWNYEIYEAVDGSEAIKFIENNKEIDLVLCDIRMAKMNGIQVLNYIHEKNRTLPIILMTAYSSVENAVEAIKLGAYTYLTKPLDFDILKKNLHDALEHIKLSTDNLYLNKNIQPDSYSMIGISDPMIDLFSLIETIAPSEATVLISGESGTGKELIAKAIQSKSLRKDMPFITLNCAALSENLLESELFGHEKGAFTGADKVREGRFVKANQGTLFLDEIGEMPLSLQVKLLRALQSGEMQRVGSDKTFTVDVRVIAATNRDLAMEVQNGNFREDLYYRLNVITIHSPALRERKSDIPLLIKYFIEKFAQANKKSITACTPKCMDILMSYDWPGNVRELENAIERAVILSNSQFLSELLLPLSLQKFANQQEHTDIIPSNFIVNKSLDEIEKEVIESVLAQTDDNKSETARRLGISRATLHSKLKKYHIVN